MKGLRLILGGMASFALVLFSLSTAQATVYFDFDTTTEGWQAEDWEHGTPTLGWTDWDQTGDPASGTLEVNTSTLTLDAFNWAKFYLTGDLSSSTDLTSTPIYTLDIYIPDTISGIAKLGVKTTDWILYEGDEITLTSGWQTLTWDMTGVSNLNDSLQLGLELQAYFPIGGTTFNIDNASASTAVPEPSAVLLLGILATGLFGVSSLRKKKK